MKSVNVQQFPHPIINLFSSGQAEPQLVGLAQNTSWMLKVAGTGSQLITQRYHTTLVYSTSTVYWSANLEATTVVFFRNLNIIEDNFLESQALRAMDQATGSPHEKHPE